MVWALCVKMGTSDSFQTNVKAQTTIERISSGKAIRCTVMPPARIAVIS